MKHVLVIANETAASQTLLDALKREAGADDDLVTVVAPVNEPRHGYVVYTDTRRAAAGRRLDKTLKLLREAGIAAQGFVVETGPVQAAKDALAQLQPAVDEVVVSTHPQERSGWMRRDVVEDIHRIAGERTFEHVVVQSGAEGTNVLVVANQTVISDALLDRIRERAAKGGASFLIVAPQSDEEEHPEADKRLRRTLSELRSEGIDVHGQVVHPDPFTAALNATNDERVDEIIVSTFPGQKSGWLRRDLVERLRKETGLPIEHVVAAA